MRVASKGHMAVVELLLSKGANMEAVDKVMIPTVWLKGSLFVSIFPLFAQFLGRKQ